MAEARRRSTARRTALLLTALLAVAALAVTLAACGGGGSTASSDPLAGYWVGGGPAGMRLVHIVKDGDSYQVFANPDFKAPTPTKEGDGLVIDTHIVKMTLTPAGTDKLTMQLTGDPLKKPQTTPLKRVDETQYADAATGLGIAAIRGGLEQWKQGGGKTYPPASEVTATGTIGRMIAWPKNLFTNAPMQSGDANGDYTYKLLSGGTSYSLVGHLSDGGTVGK